MTFYMLNLYLVDLFALPFLMSAAIEAIETDKNEVTGFRTFRVYLFLGISVAIKLSNLAFVLPIGAIFLWRALFSQRTLGFGRLLILAFVGFALPILPFTLYIFQQTGNPAFPYYNALFRSPIVSPINIHDSDHGPVSLIEKILWPYYVVIFPEKGSEWVGGPDSPYTGRITLGFVVCLIGLFNRQRGSQIRALCFLTVVSTFLWNFSSGNLRYGIFLEYLGGIAIVCVLVTAYRNERERIVGKFPGTKAIVALSLFVAVLIMQMYNSYRQIIVHRQHLFSYETQPTLFQDPRGYLTNSKYVFIDRTEDSFLTVSDLQKFKSVCTWINSVETTSGIEVELNPAANIISVGSFNSSVPDFDFLQTAYARNILKYKLGQINNNNCMYTISREERLAKTIEYLKRAGLTPTETTEIEVPFFSPYQPVKLILIRIVRAGE
jgi:hypothetical protein